MRGCRRSLGAALLRCGWRPLPLGSWPRMFGGGDRRALGALQGHICTGTATPLPVPAGGFCSSASEASADTSSLPQRSPRRCRHRRCRCVRGGCSAGGSGSAPAEGGGHRAVPPPALRPRPRPRLLPLRRWFRLGGLVAAPAGHRHDCRVRRLHPPLWPLRIPAGLVGSIVAAGGRRRRGRRHGSFIRQGRRGGWLPPLIGLR